MLTPTSCWSSASRRASRCSPPPAQRRWLSSWAFQKSSRLETRHVRRRTWRSSKTRCRPERIALAGVLPYDDVVAAADRAGPVGLVPVAAEVQRALDDVLAVLDGCRARIAR